jgi:hypothetical protein
MIRRPAPPGRLFTMSRSLPPAVLTLLLVVPGLSPAQSPTPAPRLARTTATGKRATAPPPGAAGTATDREKILYTMGTMLGFPVSSLELTDADKDGSGRA